MENYHGHVASLKRSHKAEERRREQRRVRREKQILTIRCEREDRSRQILFRNIHSLSRFNSTAESELLDSVSRAFSWWCSMCDHSIEHQLQCELAAQRIECDEVDCLSNILEREKVQSDVIFSLDTRRWEEAKRKCLENEKEAEEECIREVIETVMQTTERWIAFLESNALESEEGGQTNYLESNIIAQLALDCEMSPQTYSGTVFALKDSLLNRSAGKAFKTIFRKNPFTISCPEFLQLLLFMYKEDTSDCRVTPSFFEMSRLPIIALNGSKLSGKSVLSKHIASYYRFRCVTDKDMIEKALSIYHKKIASNASRPLEESGNTEEAWFHIGAALEQLLLCGNSVPIDLVAEMVRLEILELCCQDSPTSGDNEVAGLLLDGLVSTPAIFEHLQKTLLPTKDLLYEPVIRCWCGPTSPRQQTQDAENEDSYVDVFRIPKLSNDPTATKETKEKTIRRNAAALTLPQPTLPIVEDVSKEIAEEREFLKKATIDLGDYTSPLTAIIRIACSPEELFRRFAGLRVDQETGAEYHMVYFPPPISRLPFLSTVERTQANAVRLADIILHQEREWLQMWHWLAGRTRPNLISQVYEISGEGTFENIQTTLDDLLPRIQEKFMVAQELYKSMRASQCRLHMLETTRAQQIEEREAKRQQLISLYTEKGLSLPSELHACSMSYDETGASGRFKPACGVSKVILKATDAFTQRYVSTYSTTWKCLTLLAKQATLYRTSVVEEMERFMYLPDDKQRILDGFIRYFNSITPLMRSQASFKEEAHAIVEVLGEMLFKCVSATKKKWQQLIATLTRRESFIESWGAGLRNVGLTLAQAETERFVMVVRLFTFFFNSQLSEELGAIEEFDWDAAFACISTPENLESLSRIEKKRMPNAKKQQHPGSAAARIDDGSTRSVRDTFDEALLRLTVSLTSFTERFKPTSDATTRNQKKSATAGLLRAEAFTAHCAPFVENEMAHAMERLHCIREFVGLMASEGEQYHLKLRDKMLENITKKVYAQASAVNSALYVICCCIEEERKAPPMHLGCGTFAVLDSRGQFIDHSFQTQQPKSTHKHPSFLTDVPLCQEMPRSSLDVRPGLTFGRLRQLIVEFGSVAPNYQLSKNDFVRFVREEDYVTLPPTTAIAASMDSTAVHRKSVSAVFESFDISQVDLIDWREFVVHLLFWCHPPAARNIYGKPSIPDPTIQHLSDSKQILGSEPLSEDSFRAKNLFFAEYLSREHEQAYMEMLWLSFCDKHTKTIDPVTLLLFLCADVQLIRGAQKAISVTSQMSGEIHSLAVTRSELDRAFHTHSTNPRVLGLYDPFSARNIELLFESQVDALSTISFNQMRGCLMGRMMLNSTSLFHRKSFTR